MSLIPSVPFPIARPASLVTFASLSDSRRKGRRGAAPQSYPKMSSSSNQGSQIEVRGQGDFGPAVEMDKLVPQARDALESEASD
jgi:hypothetical protein